MIPPFKIATDKVEGGGFLYSGICHVYNETITAGVVVNGEIPEGPPKGYERVTIKWAEKRTEDSMKPGQVTRTYTSSCEFQILDRPIPKEKQ